MKVGNIARFSWVIAGVVEEAPVPLWMDEPIPEERHKHLFPDAKVPRTANFNPKHVSNPPFWLFI